MIPEHDARDIVERCDTLIESLRRYEALLPDYAISPDVWNRSIQLADRGRPSGVSVPLVKLARVETHGLASKRYAQTAA